MNIISSSCIYLFLFTMCGPLFSSEYRFLEEQDLYQQTYSNPLSIVAAHSAAFAIDMAVIATTESSFKTVGSLFTGFNHLYHMKSSISCHKLYSCTTHLLTTALTVTYLLQSKDDPIAQLMYGSKCVIGGVTLIHSLFK